MKKILTITSLIILLSHPASAGMMGAYEALDHSIYAIISNTDDNKEIITQYVAGVTPFSNYHPPVALSEFLWTPNALYSVVGQSTLFPTANFLSFDPTGSGTFNLAGGMTISAADLVPFTGMASTLFPAPPVASAAYNAYGFNLAPGQHPTTGVGFSAPPPTDGLTLGLGQSIIFRTVGPSDVTRTLGYVAFMFDNNNLSNGAELRTISFNAAPSTPVVPEPASLFLLGGGLVAALRKKIRANKY